jgi:hypothetical protein
MSRLHLAPGMSAGGSLRKALRQAGIREEVLFLPDDLSCGPIEPHDAATRVAWWSLFSDEVLQGPDIHSFWDTISTTDERLVVWFGRRCASELAFFLAVAHRLGGRPFDLVDVTDLQWSYTLPDGSTRRSKPAEAVGIIPENVLRTLLGSERQVSAKERDEAREQWRRLLIENAPVRIVGPTGLASAPIEHFDQLLLEQASRDWRKVAYVVGSAMGNSREQYIQVGDVFLGGRVAALVEAGKLLAEGDPWDLHTARVRLPG